MRAVTVCVNYANIFRECAIRNLQHFSEYIVCTSNADIDTIGLCLELGIKTHITSAFYDNESPFNKWAALEECLDVFGRHGQMCLIDADIVLPQSLNGFTPESHCIYTPVRRVVAEKTTLPDEKNWSRYPSVKAKIRGRLQQEGWAGYTQIFHADFAPQAPWHKTHLGHAGCSDTWFEEHWPKDAHKRPPFEVLHIGEPFRNWAGVENKQLSSKAIRGEVLRK